MHEFDIIEKYFHLPNEKENVTLGLGDDAAVLAATGHARVICTDTLNEGVHFPENSDPSDIAYKSLAVNLSDLAAMGAKPQFALLSLSMPKANEKWLASFADGFFTLAKAFEVALIGGDLTRGPLSINVTVIGEPCNGSYLTRSGAKVGDDIYVTGKLGGAGEALKLINEKKPLNALWHQRFYRPWPRVDVGMALAGVANSAIDISDGFLADLKHILEKSQAGARLDLTQVPHYGDLDLALTSGEDYELCFTASPENNEKIKAIAKETRCDITRVGEIIAGKQTIFDQNKKKLSIKKMGYQHF